MARKKSEAVETAAENLESEVQTSLEQPDVKKMSIYEKMAAITDEIGYVAKNMDVQGKYKAVSEIDVLDAVKKKEKKYRIFSYPYDRKVCPIENMIGKVAIRCEVIYRFINLDNDAQYIDIKAYGDGVDTLDKAPGKAMTYADKYALMKAYKISTGDDPDKEASPDYMPQNIKPQAVKPVVQAIKAPSGKPIRPDQVKFINEHISEERKQKMLTAFRKSSLEELCELDAEGVIRKLKAESEAKEKVEAKAKKEVEPFQDLEQTSLFDE